MTCICMLYELLQSAFLQWQAEKCEIWSNLPSNHAVKVPSTMLKHKYKPIDKSNINVGLLKFIQPVTIDAARLKLSMKPVQLIFYSSNV